MHVLDAAFEGDLADGGYGFEALSEKIDSPLFGPFTGNNGGSTFLGRKRSRFEKTSFFSEKLKIFLYIKRA